MDLGTIESAIKDGLRDRGPDGPEAAGPAKPALEGGAFETSTGRECDIREERAVADTDDGVGFGKGTLGSGDICPAPQHSRPDPAWNCPGRSHNGSPANTQ